MNWLQNLLKPIAGNMLQQAAQLPNDPSRGQVSIGPDGKRYQYAQTTGMAGHTGDQGWIETTLPVKPGGLMGRLDAFRSGPRGQALGDMFAGWAMGDTQQKSLAMGAMNAREGVQDRRQKQQGQQQRNQTVEWLQSQGMDPQTATMVAQNPQTLQTFMNDRLLPKTPEYDFMNVDGTLLRTSPTGDVETVGNYGAQPTTDDIKEYNFAVQQGYEGDFPTFMRENKKAGATNINMPGQPTIGTVPQGYAATQDPVTKEWTMAPIAGGPAAQEIADADRKSGLANSAAMTASDTVTTAASRAREAAADRNFGPAGTTAVANLPIVGPMTDSAEVMRNVDVLKNTAAAENLNAMRQASPTGGALGNVTEKELKLLQDKSGALDPNSPTFLRDLDDYERTLLRTIHGREAGDAIYEATRPQDAPASDDMSTKSDEELEAIINGR